MSTKKLALRVHVQHTLPASTQDCCPVRKAALGQMLQHISLLQPLFEVHRYLMCMFSTQDCSPAQAAHKAALGRCCCTAATRVSALALNGHPSLKQSPLRSVQFIKFANHDDNKVDFNSPS